MQRQFLKRHKNTVVLDRKDAATWDLGTYQKIYCRSSQQVIEGTFQKSGHFMYAINMTFKHAIKSITLSSCFHIIYTGNKKKIM